MPKQTKTRKLYSQFIQLLVKAYAIEDLFIPGYKTMWEKQDIYQPVRFTELWKEIADIIPNCERIRLVIDIVSPDCINSVRISDHCISDVSLAFTNNREHEPHNNGPNTGYDRYYSYGVSDIIYTDLLSHLKTQMSHYKIQKLFTQLIMRLL